MKKIVALDGLRGLSILLVILFHYGYLSVGWIGVQVFFVLSGYLISSILMRETKYPLGFYLKRFYWRRVWRIFPLYFSFLIFLTAAMAFTGFSPAFRQQWLSLFTYTFNFARVFPHFIYPFYWAHMWSLSVEEQFYLVWPLAVFITPAKYWRRGCLLIIILAPMIRGFTPFLFSHFSTDPDYLGNAVYNLTPCQMDAFAMGAYVATLSLAGRKNDLRNFLLVFGFTLATGVANLLAMSRGHQVDLRSFGFAINSIANYQHVWGFTLLDLSSATCILAVVNGNWLTRIFEGRLICYLGRISYGMYVFHQPMLWFLRNHNLLRQGVIYFAFYFLVLLAVSHFSFEYFETWFLNLKEKAFKAG